ncbi:SdrD B-like domain-containing protein [Haloferula sp.]|uniref:SdrD B-like domain-containing protein n=1 Tax=Haloferula sp. TaxID=2497595 RepID=UPI003C75C15F
MTNCRRLFGCPLLSALAVSALVFAVPAVHGQNPPPTQSFYIPFSEDDQLDAFAAINAAAGNPLAVFVTFSTAADNTVIYYDHWEDGYEVNLTNPTQSTTLVFGDGNPSNGYPPGNAADLIPAGTVFNLRNFVDVDTLQGVLDFDARDKVASFKPISLTKTTFPAGTNTLLAGCVEIFEYGLWGTDYRVPVGEDMPTTTASGNLTFDEDCFSYVGISVSAGPGGASVQIDKDNNGSYEETIFLAEGETAFREDVLTGARVTSDKPVQVVLFTGTVGSNYASRDTMLLPAYRWATNYYAPVTTDTSGGTVTFLYNPGASAITVSYDYRDSDSSYVTGTVSVPAGGNARVVMSESNGTSHFGAYRFYTTGPNPEAFYAISTIDADDAAGDNQAWDGGFTLVGEPSLTTQALVSLGIGRDPYSSVNPDENGNPVWVTTAGNGNSVERVYVDYNGDNAGLLSDPNGNRYDVHFDVRELEQLKLLDPDGDQSGMLIYTLNASVKIAAVWGQDPTLAAGGQPGLDVAALVPPLREGSAGKTSRLGDDVDGDGVVSAGDVLDYRISVVNTARTDIPGPFLVTDQLPADTTYVAGSTRYRFTVGGAWGDWINVPDDASGTAFPLDDSGFPIAIGAGLKVGQEIEIAFDAAIDDYGDLDPSRTAIVNTGDVEISPYGLVIPIEWSDPLYGSIGDRIWDDLDGNGIQNGGEAGINGVFVFADLNDNGVHDTGEPFDTTAGDGDYLLGGLVAGSYTIRVRSADLAGIDPGYGPTYDLDGTVTPHVAVVSLLTAESRRDVDFGYKIDSSFGDRVWADYNGDGQQDNGEPGINGVRVYIDANGNNSFDSGEIFAITSGDGDYFIGNLEDGTYEVRVDLTTLPGGAAQTHDFNGGLDHEASVTLAGVQHDDRLDFGYRGALSIGDLVWEDTNADGVRGQAYDVINARIDINRSGGVGNSDDGFIDGFEIIDGYVDINGSGSISNSDDGVFFGFTVINGEIDVNGSGGTSNSDDLTDAVGGEVGIPNVRVYLDSNGNGAWDANEVSAITDSNGNYSIGNLFDGDYLVRVDSSTLPASYVQTYDLTLPTDDDTAEVVLAGSSRTDVDFGYRNDASIGDLVWNDRDGDGIRDPGEPGIEGVLVYIDEDGDNAFDQGVERFTYTANDGSYRFENLADGSYVVRVEISTLPQGATQTYDLDGLGSGHEATRTLAVSEDAVDVDFGYRASASFGDFVWNDADGDAQQDPGEVGIPGVRVYLDVNGDGLFDPATEPSDITDGNGAYLIGNLVPGTYTARVDTSTLPAGVVQTFDLSGLLDHSATFSLSSTQQRADVDFAYAVPITIGDLVWNDLNGNGQQDSGEPGLEGVTVTLHAASDDSVIDTVDSALDGSYSFTDLPPGSYYVSFGELDGFVRTLANQGNDASDSDADALTGATDPVTLAAGGSDLTLDAGYYQPAVLGDFVWLDANANGVQDPGELGLEGVDVELFRPGFGPDGIAGNGDDDDPVGTTTTDVDGAYGFGGLAPGDYVVSFGDVSGYARSAQGQGDTDTDSDPDANGSTVPIALAAGESVDSVDAGYFPAGSVSGSVRVDTDNDGDGDDDLAGVLIRLLDELGNPVLDLAGDPVTTLTDGSGNYQFTGLLPGDYRVSQDQPSGYASVSDTDGANDNLIGAETPIVVTAGVENTGNDFVEIQFGAISGTVRSDTDDDVDGDDPLESVLLALLDGNGDPVLDGSSQPITTTTDAAGNYSFTMLVPGNYQVAETQPSGYGSVSDVDGGNPDLIGNVTPITVPPGVEVSGRDFVEIELGSISGFVLVGSDPLGGVTLTLLDENGDPVDGDPVTPGVQPITTVSQSNGSYVFNEVVPGIYQVGQTQPFGYESVSDIDGGDINIIGDVSPITILPGQSSENNNFVEKVDTCPDNWAEWKAQHPGEEADGNPDGDDYDNLTEFAFAMNAGSGAGDPWEIRPSETVPGALDAVFTRPKGAPENVVYTLEYAATLGNPVSWTSVEITPSMITSAVDNGDCTETITIADIETVTGLTGGTGVVRICIALDEENDNSVDHAACTHVEGWTATDFGICCQTYNNPYLRSRVFTGTVESGGVSGQTLDFTLSAGGVDIGSLLGSGGTYFLEVTSGVNEGHRFDVVSASGSVVTLANDADLNAKEPPYNTLAGALPSSLEGAEVEIRSHWTLDEVFPPSAFGAAASELDADQVQIHSGGGWTIYWLSNDGGTPKWVEMGGSMDDQGDTIVPPGQGMFYNSRNAPSSLLVFGEIRQNDFRRPLAVGMNLVSGGYPMDQSANGTATREMTKTVSFFGSLDFKTADSFFVWRGDASPGSGNYDSYYLADGSPTAPTLLRWVKIGDAGAAPRDGEILLLGNRSVFVRSASGLESYGYPRPWAP